MVSPARSDRGFDTVVNVLLGLVIVAAVLPLLVVVSASFTPYSEILSNGGYTLPTEFTLDGYRMVLADSRLQQGFVVTTFVTVVGTALNLVVSVLFAYPLSQHRLPGRRGILFVALLTTLFSAGIIPTYLVVKATGLLDTVWAMIIPTTISVFNVFILKTFFEGIPGELFEAARIDGAGELRLLLRIVVPLAVPVLMTIGLFYAVGHWNTFMAAVLYIRDADLQPLQVVLRNLLTEVSSDAAADPDAVVPTVTFRMSAVVLTALPMILLYPFIQKHFRHGVMLGSVKG
ncbi:binding-protein-dependent transport systems inner membrane component [Beutenbergia cavernae DSM 12333]|uniref:Binding-protein-dependent transport systems inner membrane component n=1 Tax=Beutenbergia cavernae (strain ATCC BAA-8 / DSM 12333 / CCUG 43141 / JCM 11478 / NBRC 16432 / NCIMB 13614 / HKI 0122) TaxID=471853 RepID=C5C501_BEUC1|nr:binding-protein-dependent transport systems inner membrane component [Beutenbergia cavernae DSM 12333]